MASPLLLTNGEPLLLHDGGDLLLHVAEVCLNVTVDVAAPDVLFDFDAPSADVTIGVPQVTIELEWC